MTDHKVSEPDHPLAHFKSGTPLGRLHAMYFGGYYYVRVHNGPLTITFRPTAVGADHRSKDIQSKFWYWPLPPGIIPNPNGGGYIPESHWRRQQRRAEARWNAGRF